MSGYSLLPILLITLLSCESTEQKEERLAKQYCSNCHLFPDPKLLPKTLWKNEVLPNMAFRMGLKDLMEGARYVPMDDLVTVASTLPQKPMVGEDEWKSIVSYFEKNAPDSLVAEEEFTLENLELFEPIKISDPEGSLPLVTLIKVDTLHKKTFLGTRSGKLYQLNGQLETVASAQLSSPPSFIEFGKGKFTISLMGIMDPNDRSKGELAAFKEGTDAKEILVDSIKRPVYFEEVDLNKDGKKEFIVCAFGNYTGELAVYENKGDSNYSKHVLSSLPGSRKTLAQDFNNDGLTDILALFTQGDEQITLFMNEGNFRFKQKILLRFPPVYGSTYFDIVDFNKDGRFDILYSNGDNSDYSQIIKPYHGVRIFLQDEAGNFSESWFHPMPGASKAAAFDFDLDGDLDIASFSFFPDFYKSPDRGFIFFENKDGKFQARTTLAGTSGRWIVMDVADLEGDGDLDILLGALDFGTKVPKLLFQSWEQEKTAVLILKNRTR
jgi:hypothetical protein